MSNKRHMHLQVLLKNVLKLKQIALIWFIQTHCKYPKMQVSCLEILLTIVIIQISN